MLASPMKLQILASLAEHGPMTVDELLELCAAGRTRSAIYGHLQALKAAPWIEVVGLRRVRGTAEETLGLTATGQAAHWDELLAQLAALPQPGLTPPR